MAFWSAAEVSPKRQYRWVMNIGGIPQWIIKKVNKPGFSISEATHKYLNHTFYYPGRVEYEKTSVTLVDPVDPDATAIMMQILANSGYSIPTDANETVTISKKAATRALGNVVIAQIGAQGEAVDEFELVNAWLSSAKFGDLDYESDDLTDLTIEIRYDFVVMPIHGPGRELASGSRPGGLTTKGQQTGEAIIGGSLFARGT